MDETGFGYGMAVDQIHDYLRTWFPDETAPELAGKSEAELFQMITDGCCAALEGFMEGLLENAADHGELR